MSRFRDDMAQRQLRWRTAQRGRVDQNPCVWRTRGREVVVPLAFPFGRWTDNLWSDVADEIGRLSAGEIRRHNWANHLLSSWALCANLYYPFGRDPESRALLARFLADSVAPELAGLDSVELEYAPEDPNDPLHPRQLLGETGGRRGAGQTSPDVALIGRLKNGGRAIFLVESKFTEESFYPCSAFKRSSDQDRRLDRCDDALRVLANPDSQCYLAETHGRLYWQRLSSAVRRDALQQFGPCPAKTAAYQLFRQQALAEGYAESGRYALVVSAVAYDERNTHLLGCLADDGIPDFRVGWGRLFSGKARFVTLSHATWVSWVKNHDRDKTWGGWLAYVGERYGYGEQAR